MADWFTLDAKGRALLPVRVQPRASRARIAGLENDGDGGCALKIAVTAPPEDGKANDAVIALLAKSLGLAKSRIEIATGASGRRKLLRIADVEDHIVARLRQWSVQ